MINKKLAQVQPPTKNQEMSLSVWSWGSYRDSVKLILKGETDKTLTAAKKTIYLNMLALGMKDKAGNKLEKRDLPGVRTKKYLKDKEKYLRDKEKYLRDKENDKYETMYYVPNIFMLMHTFLMPNNWDEWADKSKLMADEAIPLMCGMPPNIWKNREGHQIKPSKFIWEQWVGYISRDLEVYELDGSLPKFRTPTEWLDWGRANGLDKPSLKSSSELDKPDICLWEPFASAIKKLPIPQDKNLSASASFPLDTKWEDMTWTLLTHEMVRVEAKGVSKKYHYSVLGFADRRKGDSPDSQWTLLCTLAKLNGEIPWDAKINEKMRNKISTFVKIIRKRLKEFFKIDDDPFYPYWKTKSYKTKFAIKDARETRDTINHEQEMYPEEGIENTKQFIEEQAAEDLLRESSRTNTGYDDEK